MLKPRLLLLWVTATVALVALAPYVLGLVQMLTPIDGIHDGEI